MAKRILAALLLLGLLGAGFPLQACSSTATHDIVLVSNHSVLASFSVGMKRTSTHFRATWLALASLSAAELPRASDRLAEPAETPRTIFTARSSESPRAPPFTFASPVL